MNSILELFKRFSESNLSTILLIILIAYLIRGLIIRVLRKHVKEQKSFYKAKRSITYAYFTLVSLVVILIWADTDSVGTYLGLLSAGLAIALKDIFINIAAWIFIFIKKPFDVGDRIEINGHTGDVIDKRLFQFTLMEVGNWVSSDQSTGRMIHIPNSMVFTFPLANFSSGFEYIWNEVDVLLTFESDFKKAKPLFLAIAEKYSLHLTDEIEEKLKQASKKYLIYYNILTPIVYTDVKESGVMLSIRYLCPPRQRRNTTESIWEDVLQVIDDNSDISLAYNTLRLVDKANR